MAKNVAILTSGGDAPGMNTALRAITYTAINKGFNVFAVYDGYKGLVNGNIKQINKEYVDEIINKGGTIIRSARLPEFKDPEVRKIAINELKKHNIDSLIVIGGDGSYMGAKKLSEEGVLCIALPGTIDNDISSTDITIGFDTALNTVVDSIDKIKDTGRSHSRCMVVEVMGNKCDDLAIYSGIATGADLVISANHPVDDQTIINELKTKKDNGQNFALVILAEKYINLDNLVSLISKNTGWDTRSTILGHTQRGGTPSAMERVNASRMGFHAVELLEKGISGVCVGIEKGEVVHKDIYEALNIKSTSSRELKTIIDNVK